MRQDRCTHRWILSEPDVQGVRGECRRCGAKRTYPTGLDLPVVSQEYRELGESQPIALVPAYEEPAAA